MDNNRPTDAYRQEINIGDKVVWLTHHYSDSVFETYVVVAITEKRVAICHEKYVNLPDFRPSYTPHRGVLVINKLLEDNNES
jgi:hypothetical protein